MAVTPDVRSGTGLHLAEAAPPRKSVPTVKVFASLGVLFLAIQTWAVTGWIVSGDAQRTPTGSTPVPGWMALAVHAAEAISLAALVAFVFFVLIRPWRREGRVTRDGLFTMVFATVWWQDTLENGFQHWLTYNSEFFNLGNWDAHVPGWLSPNGNLIPAPLLFYPAYVWGIYGGMMAGGWVMTRAKARWPHLGTFGVVMVGFAFFSIFALVEPPILMLGLWSYPGAIEWLTLFHGHYYQYPLNEWVVFATLMTAWTAFRHFRDDKGRTLAERGIDDLRVRGWRRTGIRFLALVGACNAIFLVTYTVPNAIAGLYASPWPKDVTDRSYLTDGLCGPGTDYACSGPGIPIPRPDSAHVGVNGDLVVPAATRIP